MRQAKENHWPQPLPSSDLLYADYYNQIHHLAHNIVCACCGCISHSINDHESLSVSDPALSVLAYALVVWLSLVRWQDEEKGWLWGRWKDGKMMNFVKNVARESLFLPVARTEGGERSLLTKIRALDRGWFTTRWTAPRSWWSKYEDVTPSNSDSELKFDGLRPVEQ